ncbi:MAG: Phenylacetic acid degradation operon negative regulatory protein PaaX [Solirubrobacterales bacterium]|nr:Phenylacetic acid degradation operon negative regulatory protein PaaX [Solirubrobacterales bacterium]
MTEPRSAPALQPQDLVLTIFGAYVREPGETVWSGGMVEILGELGFSTEAARAALARLATRGLLARHKSGRLVSYTLTTRADELMTEGDRRIFSFGRTAPATDIWTVLWHAIPETRRVERSRFASRLRFLGFGSVQDATWVAARNREQEVLLLLRELEIEAYASVLVGRLSRGLPPVALIAQAWDLEAVGRNYDAFISEFGPYRKAKRRKGLDPQRAFVTRTLLLHRFRGFPFADPELPETVSDGHAQRAEVVATFDEVYSALAAPAEEHFRAVAQPVARARR